MISWGRSRLRVTASEVCCKGSSEDTRFISVYACTCAYVYGRRKAGWEWLKVVDPPGL